jgi:hypothetical protein
VLHIPSSFYFLPAYHKGSTNRENAMPFEFEDWIESHASDMQSHGFPASAVVCRNWRQVGLALAFLEAARLQDKVSVVIHPSLTAMVIGTKSDEVSKTLRTGLEAYERATNDIRPGHAP